LPKVGPAKFWTKGGEKDEENQTLIQKDSEGDESEPSQADEEVNRPDSNRWYPKNFKKNSWDAA
jgi:hypothetical protein